MLSIRICGDLLRRNRIILAQCRRGQFYVLERLAGLAGSQG